MSVEKDVLPFVNESQQTGHELDVDEQARLQRSVVEMALSKIEGVDGLFVGGLWALRRSDSLIDRGITHVLSLVSFDPSSLNNFQSEPFAEYGKRFKHLLIDIDDVDDEDILIHLPQAIQFIDEALRGAGEVGSRKGAVFVHCAAGKSRSVSIVVAYLLWKYPGRFDPPSSSIPAIRSRKETATKAVKSALEFIRRSRPMAEPNVGFMQQLALWWEWSCPHAIETLPAYQRWCYQREVNESVRLGMAPSRLRFEDEVGRLDNSGVSTSGLRSLRCKKCRRMLATEKYVLQHSAPSPSAELDPTPVATNLGPPQSPISTCQHVFIEPLSWMRAELEKGEMNGRLNCPNVRCAAGVGRYDWKGFRCTCGTWLTPAFSLQRSRVDEEASKHTAAGFADRASNLGIRLPPGSCRGGGNL